MTATSWSPRRGLDPTPDQAHDWLDQELHRPAYRDPWLDSVIRWVVDHLRALVESADKVAGLSMVITVLLALAAVALMLWVVPRVRRGTPALTLEGAVLEDLSVSARSYRERAARALAEARYDDAVLEGFRAIAREMSDRTLLDDAPGMTAHEMGLALAQPFPDHADRLAEAANTFDSVRYGHRGASASQAREVHELDADLVRARPLLVPPTTPLQDLLV